MKSPIRARRLGQVFLVNREIAKAEAEHAHGKRILEIGPGHGILTRELCERAASVVAVEKDKLLYDELRRSMEQKNLRLVNADFVKLCEEEPLHEQTDILISNIPYGISSFVIGWLSAHKMEAVLCLQKEFVEHMLATPGTRSYSRLSVLSSLQLRVTEIMDVKAGNFDPKPEIDSEIIFIKPTERKLSREETDVITALMQHKKKTLRRALIDSRASFNATKVEMDKISGMIGSEDRRVFMLDPEELLKLAKKLIDIRKSSKPPGSP
jgi:16S rRNA (adenine1518-N6/adenine1519-N6)-dimethyltransferase